MNNGNEIYNSNGNIGNGNNMGMESGLCMGIITEKSAVGKLFDATHTDLGSRSGSRSGINNVKSKNYLIPGSDPRSCPGSGPGSGTFSGTGTGFSSGSGPGSGSFSPMLVLESAVESPTERMSVPLIFYDENENSRERERENGNGRGRGTETGTERDTETDREEGRGTETGRGTGNGVGTVKDRIRAIETTSATTSATTSGKEKDLGVVQTNLIPIVENEFGSGSKKNSNKNLSTPKNINSPINISPQISPQKNEIKNEINKIKDVKDVEKIEKNVVLPKKKKDIIRVNNLVVTGDSLDDDESHLRACID